MAKFMFLGKAESAIRFDIKSSFADLRLSTNDSIWGLLSFFLNILVHGINPMLWSQDEEEQDEKSQTHSKAQSFSLLYPCISGS